MFWDSYIDNLIKQSNDSCDRAAIVSLASGEWLANPHSAWGERIRLQDKERRRIAYMMKSGDFSSARSIGIVLEGKNYQFSGGDGEVVFAKRTDFGAITIQKSKSAVIIAHTREGSEQSYTNEAVSVLVDYLKGLET